MKVISAPLILYPMVIGCVTAIYVEDASAGNLEPDTNPEYTEFAHIFANGVASPLGSYVLIRRKTEACAVRFFDPMRGHDSTKATRWTSGEETTSSKYESIYQEDGSFDLTRSTVVKESGEIYNRASFGLGHIVSLKPGENHRVHCGSFDVDASYLGIVGFGTHSGEKYLWNDDVEMAPTAISDVQKIDFKNSKLTWFRVASSEFIRPEQRIPKTSLPQ